MRARPERRLPKARAEEGHRAVHTAMGVQHDDAVRRGGLRGTGRRSTTRAPTARPARVYARRAFRRPSAARRRRRSRRRACATGLGPTQAPRGGRAASSRWSSVPSPATTWSAPAREVRDPRVGEGPVQAGKRGERRGASSARCPSGRARPVRSGRRRAMKRPCGDNVASRYAPSRRREPSAFTTQVPPGRTRAADRGPAARRAPFARARRRPPCARVDHDRPAGSARSHGCRDQRAATSGRVWRRGQVTGSRAAYAVRATSQARSAASCSFGARKRFTPAAP